MSKEMSYQTEDNNRFNVKTELIPSNILSEGNKEKSN